MSRLPHPEAVRANRSANERIHRMQERHKKRERRLAQAILSLADAACMPDSFWDSDSRIVLAREALEVPRDGRYTHAHLWSYE